MIIQNPFLLHFDKLDTNSFKGNGSIRRQILKTILQRTNFCRDVQCNHQITKPFLIRKLQIQLKKFLIELSYFCNS